MMKTAVVTGANGFVGKAVVRELLSRGVRVYAVVRKSAQHLDGLEQAILIECDLSEYASLAEKIEQKPDVFFHFAWQGCSGPSRADDVVQIQNISACCAAVRAAAQLGCGRFVFASSIMEYEVLSLMKTRKTLPGSAIYSTAKLTANFFARILSAQLGVEYVAGIISNIYGPGEDSPRLINTSLRKLMHGDHVGFSRGDQTYDFIYITDAANIFVELGQQQLSRPAYYIGNAAQRPLKEFLLEMGSITKCDAQIGLGEISFDGVSLDYAEFYPAATERELGISPKVDFRQGILLTIDWIRKRGGATYGGI